MHLFASHEPQGNFLYDPRAYARDPELLKRLLTLDVRKQQAAAELMNGQILKHNFYARRTPVKKPLPQDDQWLPFCWMMYTEDTAYKGLSDAVAKVEVGKEVVFREDDSKGVVSFIKNPLSQAVVDVLDGKNTIRDILKRVQAKHPSASRNQIGDAFVSIYSALHLHNWMLLRDPKIKPFLSATELQKRFLAMHP